MKTLRATLLALLLLPGAAWSEPVRVVDEAQTLFEFYQKNFFQAAFSGSSGLYREGKVLFGNLEVTGTSSTTTSDPIGLARTIANHARTQFAIPDDYEWVLEERYGAIGQLAGGSSWFSSR